MSKILDENSDPYAKLNLPIISSSTIKKEYKSLSLTEYSSTSASGTEKQSKEEERTHKNICIRQNSLCKHQKILPLYGQT